LGFRVTRRAQASWQGTDEDGSGRITLGSGAFEGVYNLRGRVSEGEPTTNPEELIAAAEAGCFTMSLSNLLTEHGHPPDDLRTTAKVQLEQVEGGFDITLIEVSTIGEVPGIDQSTFAELANKAKSCPISRALAGTRITVTAALASD
jgi:lipoyl-dependent peroxiredoxin